MPNWCDNSITISHPDPTMMERAVKAWNDHKFLQEFIPCPQELTETMAGFCGKGTYAQELLEFKQNLNLKFFGFKNWYDFNNAKWGCKWDIGGDADLDNQLHPNESKTQFSSHFDSPWCPPIAGYHELVKLGFSIHAYYYESGMGFCGRFTTEDGDDYYEITGDSDWVKKNIPDDIDNEFCISENMAEWEAMP